MVKQSAPDGLRDYADENRLFHCTDVSVLYLVVLDAYTKVLPSGAGSEDPLCACVRFLTRVQAPSVGAVRLLAQIQRWVIRPLIPSHFALATGRC